VITRHCLGSTVVPIGMVFAPMGMRIPQLFPAGGGL
jgi:hypothetical protein